MIRLFHLLKKGNQVLFIICEELTSCLGRANVRSFHENPNRICLLSLKTHITKRQKEMFLSTAEIFEAS